MGYINFADVCFKVRFRLALIRRLISHFQLGLVCLKSSMALDI